MTCQVGPGCEQPAVRAALDHGCVCCTRDPAIVAKRLAGSQLGGRVAADDTRLATPKHALRYLARFTGALASNPTPDVINAVQVAKGVVEIALKLMDVASLEAENKQLRTLLGEARPDLRKSLGLVR